MPARGSGCCKWALLLAALSIALPASARDPADSGSEEIPIGGDPAAETGDLDALAEADIWQALRVRDLDELARLAPSLEIDTRFASINPNLFVRGVGLKDHSANAPGPVGVYHDGVSLNAPALQLGQAFDLEAVEVLRGPQGSRYAQNASAGALLLRSALPDGEFGVQTSLSYGSYDYKRLEAAIDVPLVEDLLSMRVSGVASWRDGYTKNQCAGWNPEQHINPLTGEPFRRIDEQSTRDLYFDLQPAGQWTFDPGTGRYELGPVMIERENGTQGREEFVYLNYDRALEEVRTRQVSNVNVRENNSWVLAEDLRDPTGAVIATAGTRVAYMSTTLQFSPQAVDGICILQEPGKLATLDGEINPPGFVPPEWGEGYWDETRIQPGLEDFAQLERWTNDVDHWAARMVLLYEPLDEMEWMVNVHGSQNRGDSEHLQMLGVDSKVEKLGFYEAGQNGFSENRAAIRSGFRLGEGVRNVKGIDDTDGISGQGGGNPYSGFYDSDGTHHIDAWGVNGWGRWDLGPAVVTLLYDYEWYARVVEDEGDANPVIVFPSIRSHSAWQTTEELRVEGDGERFRWTASFFFLHERLRATNFFPATQNFRIEQNFDQELTSLAPYASGEIDLVEPGAIPGVHALTLGGGIRYHRERRKFELTSSAMPSESLFTARVLPETDRRDTRNAWTGDAQLGYTPFANECGTLLAYLRYARGFTGGRFNADLTIEGGNEIRQRIDPVRPVLGEGLEFGLRSRWWDDRVILDAAVFRYWYQDLQVFDIVDEVTNLPLPQLFNGDADVLGAEAELQLRPLAGLLVAANLGWLDAEYDDFAVTKLVRRGGRAQPLPTDFDYHGNRLEAAPAWSFAVLAEYEIPLFGWGALVPRYGVNYRSKAYLDPQMLDPISQDGYWLHDARIAYRTRGERIELAFWVRNLLDQPYKIDAFAIAREFNTILEVWGEPRMYGVTLSLNW